MQLHRKLMVEIKYNKNILKNNQHQDVVDNIMSAFDISTSEARTLILMLMYEIKTDRSCNAYSMRNDLKLNSEEYCLIIENSLTLQNKGLLLSDSLRRGKRRIDIELSPNFSFSPKVISYVLKGTFEQDETDFRNLYSILERFEKLLAAKDDNGISSDELHDKVTELSEKCDETVSIYRVLKRLKADEKPFLLYLLLKRMEGDDDIWLSRYTGDVFESIKETGQFREKFFKGQLILQKDGLLEIDEEKHFFKSDVSVGLSRKFISTYLDTFKSGTEIKFESKFLKVIKHVNVESSLIFNGSLKSEIDTIVKAVSKTRLRQLRKKLKDNKMPVGFTCLLHGAPGTGKTASVYDIAAKAKRDVLHVDISSIRSMWVGEGEKNLKKVFEDYYEAKKMYDNTPILLFNESDSLISKRVEASRSVDQMNNAMQNILLEELERFDGILFATTNLTMNMDDAFSRRFLYKVCFPVPDAALRAEIWKLKMPSLTAKEAALLGTYKASGGQIENVCRKVLIDSMLHNTKPKLCDIEVLLKNEISFKQEDKIVGF